MKTFPRKLHLDYLDEIKTLQDGLKPTAPCQMKKVLVCVE